MSWLNDLRGKTIKFGSLIMPDRAALEFSGDGVTVTDNAAQNTTEVFISPVAEQSGVTSLFGRTGQVRAQVGDYTASLVSFDNTGTGLSATECQTALFELDALVSALPTLEPAVSPIQTFSGLLLLSDGEIGKLLVSEGTTGFDIIDIPDDAVSSIPLGTKFRITNNSASDPVIPLIVLPSGSAEVVGPVEGAFPAAINRYDYIELTKIEPDKWLISESPAKLPVYANASFDAVSVSPGATFPVSISDSNGVTVNGSNEFEFSVPGTYRVTYNTTGVGAGSSGSSYAVEIVSSSDGVIGTSRGDKNGSNQVQVFGTATANITTGTTLLLRLTSSGLNNITMTSSNSTILIERTAEAQ